MQEICTHLSKALTNAVDTRTPIAATAVVGALRTPHSSADTASGVHAAHKTVTFATNDLVPGSELDSRLEIICERTCRNVTHYKKLKRHDARWSRTIRRVTRDADTGNLLEDVDVRNKTDVELEQ